MKKTNTLIIGQGIAGSLMAYMLHLQKIPFIVIDPAFENTSSRIAAGMFTPISGKRKTIDPLVLQQIPYAIKTYREMEQLTRVDFLHLNNVYQFYNTEVEQNALTSKLTSAAYAKFITTNPGAIPHIKQEIGAFEINHSGWVDCELMISGFANWLTKNDSLITASFIYEDLQIGQDAMEYHGIVFKNIIFCEGYRAMGNPFFNTEKIIPCKGDMLTIKYENLVTDRIIKRNGIYLVSKGDHLFKAGATYQWNNNNEQPEEPGKILIEDQLDALLANKYTTVSHKAAIRPTTQNREVIAKQHPDIAGMFILNGLGTKGILQGPWFARDLVKLIVR